MSAGAKTFFPPWQANARKKVELKPRQSEGKQVERKGENVGTLFFYQNLATFLKQAMFALKE